MPDLAPQSITPSPGRSLVGWLAAAVLLVMLVAALFGDLFVWAVCGTKFVLSPRFNQVEGWLRALLGTSFIGFLIFERGAEHLRQKRWKPFLLGVLIFIIATLPFAKPCALLTRFATVKGVAALAQYKAAWLVTLLLLILVCKCRAAFNLWRLIRTSSEPRETRRIVISK